MRRLTATTALVLSSVLLPLDGAEERRAGKEAESYRAEFEAWRRDRVAGLKAADGWLTLAGLFWLQEGDNSFGSAADNDILFPEPRRHTSACLL